MPTSEELYEQGLEAFRRGANELSRVLNERALQQATASADDLNTARALIGLCRVAFRERDHAEIERLAAECGPVYDRLPDKLAVTSPRHMLAESCRMHGRFDEARNHYRRNIEEALSLGGEARVRVEMGNLALLDVATRNYQEALRIADELLPGSEVDSERAYIQLARGGALAGLGRRGEAKEALDECKALLDKLGEVLDPADQPIYDEATR